MPKVLTDVGGIPQQKDKLTPNSYITDENKWENKIYLIDEQDYVHGGKDGYDNIPHEQLANRTVFLRDTCNKIINDVQEFKAKVAEQQLADAQEMAAIRAFSRTLREDLDSLTAHVNVHDEEEKQIINAINQSITKLQFDLIHHTHNYAGSDTAGGDANTVKVTENEHISAPVVGVVGNKLEYNNNITIDNAGIHSPKFIGNLEGVANAANRLVKHITISYYGDVVGSYMFDGTVDNIQVNLSLLKSSVTKGTYGPNTNKTLSMEDQFTVPKLTINDKGIITHAENVSYTMPSEAMSETTNATQNLGKLFLIGAQNQNQKEYTFSNNKAYQINGTLYSNDQRVVNVSDSQDLVNKTYEGFKLAEACSRGVDESIQGTDGSNQLITSNAMYNHKHDYALSDKSGKALSVVMTENNEDKCNLVITPAATGKMNYNTEVYVQGKDLTAPIIHATDLIHIPGGKLWIDTSAKAIDGSSYNPSLVKKVAEMQEILQTLRKEVAQVLTQYKSKVAEGVTCKRYNILSYQKGGYQLATNTDDNLSTKLVMALTDSNDKNEVTVCVSGKVDTDDGNNDGKIIYLGTNGRMTYIRPTKAGTNVVVLGHMENNMIIFNGNAVGIKIQK